MQRDRTPGFKAWKARQVRAAWDSRSNRNMVVEVGSIKSDVPSNYAPKSRHGLYLRQAEVIKAVSKRAFR